MEPSRVWVFVSIDYGIIDYSVWSRVLYNWLYHNEWTANLQHQKKKFCLPSYICTSPSIPHHAPKYSPLLYKKSFQIICLVFFFSKSPPSLKAALSWHCTVGHRDTNIRMRTDSIQHVEPIAFEHLNVRRQILATVDPCKMKWVLTVRTGNRHLWEIEQLQLLWNSLRIESSTVVVVELSENWEFHSRWLGMDNLVAACTEKTPRSWYMFDCSTYGKTHHVWSIPAITALWRLWYKSLTLFYRVEQWREGTRHYEEK